MPLPLDLDPPSPKRLALDLLACAPDRLVPVSAVVAAGACFHMAENSIRMALGRLVTAGLVSHEDRSLYRLAPRSAELLHEIGEWRELGRKLRPWQGGWIGVLPGFRSPRVPRRSISRAGARTLGFLGFRDFDAGLRLRPDNIAGGVDRVRRALHARGLERTALVCELRSLGPAHEQRARRLWPVPALVRNYGRSLEALETSRKRIPKLSLCGALAETFVLIGHVERQLVLDPRLPDEILESPLRDVLDEALQSYVAEAGEVWLDFLTEHGLSGAACPRGTGLLAEAKEVLLPALQPDAVGI